MQAGIQCFQNRLLKRNLKVQYLMYQWAFLCVNMQKRVLEVLMLKEL